MTFKEIIKVTGVPVLFASMCCLSPLLLVVFGLGSVSFAAGLADTFYGEYKWLFAVLDFSFWQFFFSFIFAKREFARLMQQNETEIKLSIPF